MKRTSPKIANTNFETLFPIAKKMTTAKIIPNASLMDSMPIKRRRKQDTVVLIIVAIFKRLSVNELLFFFMARTDFSVIRKNQEVN